MLLNVLLLAEAEYAALAVGKTRWRRMSTQLRLFGKSRFNRKCIPEAMVTENLLMAF